MHGPRLHYTAVLTLDKQSPALTFPNLRQLSLSVHGVGPRFVSPRVTRLTLYMTPTTFFTDRTARKAEIKEIFANLPNVEELMLIGTVHLKHIACDALGHCRDLRNLRTITIPSSAISTPVFTCLSRISSLQAIHLAEFCPVLHIHRSAALPTRSSTIGPMPILHKHAFRRVDTMALAATLSGHVLPRLLVHRNFPGSQLKCLRIRLATGPFIPTLKFQLLLDCLRKTCMNLEELTLKVGPREHANLVDVDTVQPLHYADIASAFGFKHLKHLYIEHPAPIKLRPVDILYVAQGSRRLESLWLNPEPALQDFPAYEDAFPIESLRAFAKYCTSMKRLGLYLGGKPNFVSWNIFHHFSQHRFTQLDDLVLGESPATILPHFSRHDRETPVTDDLIKERQRCIKDWTAIAAVLAEVLSPRTTIHTALDSYLESVYRPCGRWPPLVVWKDDTYFPKAEMRLSWHAIRALSLFLAKHEY